MKDTVTWKGNDTNHWHYCWALQIFIVSHGLQMIWCQQSSFIISAVLVSTLKYIFHSKFWCSASMICHFIDTLVLENCNFRSLRSPWKVLEFCPFSLLWTLLQTRDGRLVSVLVSAVVSAIPIPNRYHWYRPDTDTEYWYRSKPNNLCSKYPPFSLTWAWIRRSHPRHSVAVTLSHVSGDSGLWMKICLMLKLLS